MPAVVSSAAFRAFIAAVTTLAPVLSTRASEPRADAYLTEQSVAAATVRLADIAKTPLVQAYPVEVIAAATDDFLGIRLDSIQRVTAIVEPPMGIMPQYAVVLNSSEAISFNRFRSELTRHTQLGELLGRPLLESQIDLAPSLCLLDDHTLAVGPKLFLKRYLRGVDGSDSELAAAMRQGDGDQQHLHAAVLLEPIRPFIELGLMAAKQDPEFPPQAHKYLEAVLLVDRIVATSDLSGHRESSLKVYGTDQSATDQLASLTSEGIDEIRARIAEDTDSDELKKMRGHREATIRAIPVYIDRIVDQYLSACKPERESKEALVFGRIPAGDPASAATSTAVIGILVALLLPAVQAAREESRRNQSMNNMKELVLAVHRYHDKHGSLPAQAICTEDGTPLLSWRVAVLPHLTYTDATDLYERFRLDEPWDSPHNKPLMAEMPDIFLDPSSPQLKPTDGKTHYLGVAGPAAIFRGADKRMFEDLTDGSSTTLMLVQVDDVHAIGWTKPVDFNSEVHDENPIGGIGSLHPGVFLASFLDGSTIPVGLDTAPELLRAAFTIAGGEEEADLR